ncbi:MAG: hypothetical protein KBT30_01235 [Clostridiales bacterium]|nr:hypothetical protein [Candidatus Apopatousia equi]
MSRYNYETKQSIEALKDITSNFARMSRVKDNPEVIIFACKFWNDDKDGFRKLIEAALVRKPELITQFKGKNGLKVKDEYIRLAVLTDPMVMASMNKEMKDKIDSKLFIEAFVKNPLVLTVKDLDCLKTRFKRIITVKGKDSKVEEKEVSSSLRTECLKAIRLSEGVSKYHQGYDDMALTISRQLDKSKNFQKTKYSPELLKNFATLVNSMIKKKNQKLRAVTVDAWLVNKGKPMYKAVRTSAEENSELEGLLADLPTAMLPEKLVERLIIAGVKINPDLFAHLAEYGLAKYIDSPTIKYNVYKSLKKHGMLKKASEYLDECDIAKSKNKLNGAEKREKARKEKEAEEKTLEA